VKCDNGLPWQPVLLFILSEVVASEANDRVGKIAFKITKAKVNIGNRPTAAARTTTILLPNRYMRNLWIETK
jgi:hypothetical protein